VVGLATAMAVLLYLDRYCVSFVERYIKDDLRLSDAQSGWILSAFFWSYALGQVPAGWLSDRFGPRLTLAAYIVLWSLFTGLLGAADALLLVVALRLGCGLAQAGAYPASANLLSKWVPFPSRGVASGIVSLGGRLGGALAPVLTAYLIVAFLPAGAPALLRSDDLLDTRRLCAELAQPSSGPGHLGMRVLALMPTEVVRLVRQLASDEAPQPSQEQLQTLVAGLNDVLARPDLFQADDRNAVPLPREALVLAARPRADLSTAQIERLNRFLLETAYPQLLRKLYGGGWRPVMWIYCGAGLLLSAMFWLWLRDEPRRHPRCNAAEVELIEESRPPGAVSPYGRVDALPWRFLVTSRSLTLSSISQFATNFGWAFLLTWLPRYLADVHRVPVLARGWLAGVPLLVGIVGMFAGGWLTDRLTRRFGLRRGRGWPMSLTRFVAMGAYAYVACLGLESAAAATAAFALVALATDLGTPAVWAFMQDAGGRHVGSILGWGNMWGNFGAALSPLVLNRVIEGYGWNALFLICAAAYLVAGLAALGIDATVPIIAEKQVSADVARDSDPAHDFA
jgi:sugar phosphate permease